MSQPAPIEVGNLVTYATRCESWDRDPGPKKHRGRHLVEVTHIDGTKIGVRSIFGTRFTIAASAVIEVNTDRSTWEMMWKHSPKVSK